MVCSFFGALTACRQLKAAVDLIYEKGGEKVPERD